MQIMNVARKAILPIAVAGAVGLGTSCTGGKLVENKGYIKNSGISAKAYDSLERACCKAGGSTHEFWQKAADDIKYKAKIDSVKKATIDSMKMLKK